MCGILGIANRNDDVFAEIYDGLLMLQHRGQDASGVVTYTGGYFRERKANGLVKDVFQASDAETLTGRVGMGHVRYPTAGSLSASEAQPFFCECALWHLPCSQRQYHQHRGAARKGDRQIQPASAHHIGQ